MIRTDSVQRWLGEVWDSSKLTRLVEGGLNHERADSSVATPYAVYQVKYDGHDQHSAGYLQRFTIDLKVYAEAGYAKSAAIERELKDLFDWPDLNVTNIAGAKVMGVEPVMTDHALSDQRREAKDVEVAGNTWRLHVSAGL